MFPFVAKTVGVPGAEGTKCVGAQMRERGKMPNVSARYVKECNIWVTKEAFDMNIIPKLA